ncbi:MAG: hypothetical protein ACJ8MO_22685 [Bacillus sp. (in: firmicutes)]
MKIYLSVRDGRVIGFGSSPSSESDIEMNVLNDHQVLENPFIFKVENGELVKDDAYQEQLVQEKEERKNRQTTAQKLELMQNALDDLILGGM